MATKIQGNAGVIADVNTDREMLIAPTLTESKAGFVTLACESDAGEVTGTRVVRAIDISRDYRMRTGVDNLLFNAKFPGAALHTGLWNQILSTMTLTVASGFATLNAGLSTASGAYAQLRTYRSFPVYGSFGIWAQANIQFSQAPVTNCTFEGGLMLAATNATPTDGVFVRITSSGVGYLVSNFAGTEVVSDTFDATTITNAVTHKVVIGVFDSIAELWIDDVLITTVDRPSSAGDLSASAALPLAFRLVNTAATAVAQTVKIGMANITLADGNINKFWSHVQAGMGASGYEGQAGGTLGSTALYTNSLAAGSGTAATNTTAALGSGLGGQFSLLPTLTAGTDGIISSYQVPAATNAVPGKCLYIRGVKINGVVTTALTGGPVIGAFSLAYGHTSVSLATTDGAGTKAPRRIPMGIQVYASAAAVGVSDDRELFLDLETPVCIQPGEFVQVVMKNLGTVTTAGVITFLIYVDGYWE